MFPKIAENLSSQNSLKALTVITLTTNQVAKNTAMVIPSRGTQYRATTTRLIAATEDTIIKSIKRFEKRIMDVSSMTRLTRVTTATYLTKIATTAAMIK